MNRYFSLMMIFSFSIALSQTKNEQKKIIDTYNSDQISDINVYLKNLNTKNIKSVKEFLIKNPEVKEIIKDKNGGIKKNKIHY
ncbi:MAG: hypothetical protein ACJ0P6_03230 [Flavobacteriaceae bacterium]